MSVRLRSTSLAPRLSTRALAACLLALSLSGCGVVHIFDPTLRQRGSLVDPDALRELIPGTSSRADAISLIGSPTARATFDDNTWIYISQVTSTRIGRTPGVTQQKVVILNFDPNGTLRSIQQRTRADSKSVDMAAGATPSPGSEASFLQQLFGNVGKFTPAGLPGGLGSGPSSQLPGNSGNSLR
jgi:outer membrane protein assembly factor BamE (lipoprotein component of BamABCDE complex)